MLVNATQTPFLPGKALCLKWENILPASATPEDVGAVFNSALMMMAGWCRFGEE